MPKKKRLSTRRTSSLARDSSIWAVNVSRFAALSLGLSEEAPKSAGQQQNS